MESRVALVAAGDGDETRGARVGRRVDMLRTRVVTDDATWLL